METLAKGKLSYYILSCLEIKDMYGLELIEEIEKKFGEKIKLPSLYSNINRMKELKYISNYLKESNEGPKRSYSSITEKGRNELANLKTAFASSLSPKESENKVEGINDVAVNENKENETAQNDDYDEFFALPEENDNSQTQQSNDIIEETDDEEPTFEEEVVQQPIISAQTENEPKVEDVRTEEFENNQKPVEKEEERVDDYAQFTQNKKLFDITQDFSKYRKKKSFTENQIVMNVNTSPALDIEKQQSNINSIKQTIENSKDGNYEPLDRFAEKENSENKIAPLELSNEYQKFNKETKDDGLFITDVIPVNEIPKAKKIEMSKLSFTVPTDYVKLPAPHRDSSLDPSHADVKARLQQLYEKANSTSKSQTKYREYDTFEELKTYYEDQDIDFKIYNKPEVKVTHNTNKLLLICEILLFSFVGIGSALLYLLFNSFGGVNIDLSFLYYLFPVVSLVFLVYRIYNAKFGFSRLPKSMLKPVIMWTIFLLGSVAIFCFAIVCGLSLVNPVTYCTCIIYPIYVFGIWLVARYYITIGLYKKYWK